MDDLICGRIAPAPVMVGPPELGRPVSCLPGGRLSVVPSGTRQAIAPGRKQRPHVVAAVVVDEQQPAARPQPALRSAD